VIGVFMVRKWKGGLLAGMFASTVTALLLHKVHFAGVRNGIFKMPDFGALGKTAFQLDIRGALHMDCSP